MKKLIYKTVLEKNKLYNSIFEILDNNTLYIKICGNEFLNEDKNKISIEFNSTILSVFIDNKEG